MSKPNARNRALRATSALAAVGLAALVAGSNFAVTNQARAQTGVDFAEWSAAMDNAVETESLLGSYLAGRQAVADRDRIAAAKYFQSALVGDPENRMLLEQAFAYSVSAGDFNVAKGLATRIVKVAPKNIGANIMISLGEFEKSNYLGAREAFSQIDNGPIAQLATGVLQAWTYVAQKNFSAAYEALKLAGTNPAFESLKNYHGALMKDLSGDIDAAKKAYTGVIAEGQLALRSVDSYGRFFERIGEPERATKAYEEFIAALPTHPVILKAVERVKSGVKPERLVRNAQEGMAETLYTLGASLIQDGGGDLALIYLNFALHLRADFPEAQYLMADILERQRRLDEAVEVYSSIEENAPLKRQAEIRAALALDTLDRTDEAKVRMDKLLVDDPKDISALTSLGDILRFRKRYEEAADYYSRAISAEGDIEDPNWRLRYSRGMTYERLKRWPEAEKDFLKALELSVDQPLVLNYLGYTWIDMGINLDEGLEMIRKAVDQRPSDGYIVDSLGWAYYKLGRFEEAVKELERAVELQTADPVINDHLGDAYWRVGRKTEARFQWSHALESKPEEEEILKIEAKLKNGLPELGPEPQTGAENKAGSDDKTMPGKDAKTKKSDQQGSLLPQRDANWRTAVAANRTLPIR